MTVTMPKLVARNYRVLSPEHFIVGGVFTSPRQALLTPALLTRYLPHLTSAYTAWQFRLIFTFTSSNPTPPFVFWLGYIVDVLYRNLRMGRGVQSRVEAVTPKQGHGEGERREDMAACLLILTFLSWEQLLPVLLETSECIYNLNDVERMLSP